MARWWQVVLPLATGRLRVLGGDQPRRVITGRRLPVLYLVCWWRTVRGVRAGRGEPEALAVPESVGFAHECFAFQPAVTAACTESLTNTLVSTQRVNNRQGLYPSFSTGR